MYLPTATATSLATSIIKFVDPSSQLPLLPFYKLHPPYFNSTSDCQWPPWPLASFLANQDGSQTSNCCSGTTFAMFGTENATNQPSVSDCRDLAAAMLPSNATHRGIREAGFYTATDFANPDSGDNSSDTSAIGSSSGWILVAHSGTCGFFIEPGLNVTGTDNSTAQTVWIGSNDIAQIIQGAVDMQARGASAQGETAGLCLFDGVGASDGASETPSMYWLNWKIDWVDPAICRGVAGDGSPSMTPTLPASTSVGTQPVTSSQSAGPTGTDPSQNGVCVASTYDASAADTASGGAGDPVSGSTEYFLE